MNGVLTVWATIAAATLGPEVAVILIIELVTVIEVGNAIVYERDEMIVRFNIILNGVKIGKFSRAVTINSPEII